MRTSLTSRPVDTGVGAKEEVGYTVDNLADLLSRIPALIKTRK